MIPSRPQMLPLTERQQRVMTLKANGASNERIGVEMGTTTNSVYTTLSRIYTKLGAHNAYHAVALCIKHRLIDIYEIEDGNPQIKDGDL